MKFGFQKLQKISINEKQEVCRIITRKCAKTVRIIGDLCYKHTLSNLVCSVYYRYHETHQMSGEVKIISTE